MIHGMWGGSWCWHNYETFFKEKGYNCVACDLPFHYVDEKNEPDPKLATLGISDYVDYVENLIMKMDKKPIVIGHSMGGLVAQKIASRGLSKSTILLAPASPYGVLGLKFSVIKSFWSSLTKWGFWRKSIRQTFKEAQYSILNLLSEEKQEEVFDRFVYESGRIAYEIGFWVLDSHKSTYVDESLIDSPMLVVAGSKDRITPAKIVKKVAKKYGHVSTFKEFPDNAHWMVEEPGWESVVECIDDWIQENI